jgi:5'-methylthioadenosine phosphorylase
MMRQVFGGIIMIIDQFSQENLGIIGGSGIYQMEGIEIIKEHMIETPFGRPSDAVIEAKLSDEVFFFLARHARGHKLLPHEINYRANVYAMKQCGVRYLLSVSAVGSLKEELPPTTFVLPDQFIDWTKGQRKRTFFGDGIIAHVSTANPIDPKLQKLAANSCEHAGVNFHVGGSYVCIEGPQFSTKAESAIYRRFGASIIGMTNVPESFLAKEAGMSYATIAMVTDYDCWKEEHCTVDEIMKVMGTNNSMAHKVLLDFILKFSSNKFYVNPENKLGVLTNRDTLSTDKQEILDVLLQ